jgi:hypothetical protein
LERNNFGYALPKIGADIDKINELKAGLGL